MTPSTKQEAERVTPTQQLREALTIAAEDFDDIVVLLSQGMAKREQIIRSAEIKAKVCRAALANSRATPSTPAPASDAPRGAVDAYRVALEHIGTGSTSDPQQEARDALIASGEWSAWDFERAKPESAQQAGDALDAARYRWLRETRKIHDKGIPWPVYLDPKELVPTSAYCVGVTLDTAIDAAMAASAKGDV